MESNHLGIERTRALPCWCRRQQIQKPAGSRSFFWCWFTRRRAGIRFHRSEQGQAAHGRQWSMSSVPTSGRVPLQTQCNAIDLPATLQGRLKTSPRDLLGTPDDLARWLVAAGMASVRPDAMQRDLDKAQLLREAIYTLANSLHGPEPGGASARQVLNRLAAEPAAVPLLQADGRACLTGTVGSLLTTLAHEAIHLFGAPQARQIKQCQSPTCTLHFIDTSRKRDRRWCSMSACGNKTKVAEFRRRKQAALG